jgi:hypothetical protein
MTAKIVAPAFKEKLLRLERPNHPYKACARAQKKERLAWASIISAVDDIRAAHIEFSNAFCKYRNLNRDR